MSTELRSRDDYYAAWDRHTVEKMVGKFGYNGAVAQCIYKKWYHLETILRAGGTPG
jgi:hypothetical protein